MDKPVSSRLGAQELTEQEVLYCGSRFAEVKEAIFRDPYYGNVWEKLGSLPTYAVTFRSLLSGLISLRKRHRFMAASRRAVISRADLRPGRDGKGYRKLLHPNGVCLTGTWKIFDDVDTDYTGYFAAGKEGLLVGRYSTCCTDPWRGSSRSLSLVGKIYPTLDPDHPEPLHTANFITQENLGGGKSTYIEEAVLRNAPDTTVTRRSPFLLGPLLLFWEGLIFLRADKEPSQRQVYPIAELGKPEGEPTRCPRFMQLTVSGSNKIEGEKLDFRDEVLGHIYDLGDPTPKRTLEFDIEVTDTGKRRGVPFFECRKLENWKKIGKLTFTEAVASYAGDHLIHFSHPVWRDDLEQPNQ